MNYTHLFIYGAVGLAIIIFISTIGAILSRLLHFRHYYLSFINTTTYVVLGFLISEEYGIAKALLINALLGLSEGTIGEKLCELCKPYLSEEDKAIRERMQLPKEWYLPLNVLVAMVLTFVGYFFSWVDLKRNH